MKHPIRGLGTFVMLGLLSLTGPLLIGAESQPVVGEVKVQGVIVESSPDAFVLKDAWGSEFRVELDGNTEVEEEKRNPFRRRKDYSAQELIPGLSVRVKGMSDRSGRILAHQIRFTQNELRVAKAISSQVGPIQQDLQESKMRQNEAEARLDAQIQKGKRNTQVLSGQVEELTSGWKVIRGETKETDQKAQLALAGIEATNVRISSLDDYDQVNLESVMFNFNSTELSDQARLVLDGLAGKLQQQKSYLVEIKGFASADGDPLYNQRLSQDRAQRVTQYLVEQHQIPARRMMIPFGFGDKHPVADNGTREGRQANRRVEVRILVSRGVKELKDVTSLTPDQVAAGELWQE